MCLPEATARAGYTIYYIGKPRVRVLIPGSVENSGRLPLGRKKAAAGGSGTMLLT